MKLQIKIAILFITLHIFAVVLTSLIIFEDIRVELEEKETLNLQKQLDTKINIVDLFLTTTKNQVIYVGQSPILLGLASSSDVGKINYEGISFNEWKKISQKLFYNMAENNPTIQQIRYIDIHGNEIVKIEQKNSTIKIIDDKFLQNKSDRYYFTEAKNQDAGTLYVSNFDLNEEFGKISYPYEPIIRYAISIHDNFGEKQGLLIFNIDMNDLSEIIQQSSLGNTILLDNLGNFILHPNQEKEFSLQLGTNYNYFIEQPELQENLQYFDSKLHHDFKEGEYRAWKKIQYDFNVNLEYADEKKYWVILTIIHEDELFAPVNNLWFTVILASFVILAITVIITIYFANRITSPIIRLKQLTNKVATGNFGQKISINTHDEISELADSIESMSKSLQKNLEIERQILKERLKLKDEKMLTEKKHAEELFKSEKLSLIGQLSARMAHDIRNPLSVIKMTLQTIEMMYGVDEKKQKQFERINRSIDRITHQIDDVLDFVRERPITLNHHKISEIISGSLDSVSIPENIKLILPKNDIMILCDKEQFLAVMTNLVLNGIQAIDGMGTIEITSEENNDGCVIKVKDSGSGIPKENHEKIFEPLFTTKQKGTGLGLAGVKSIIRSHGGTISVTSPPTIFTITLPKTIS